MSKRPLIDLMALTSEQASPMPEAVQRKPPSKDELVGEIARTRASEKAVRTENLQGLAFKVSPAFRKRFRQRAATADLKLNELLFEALDAWEAKNGLSK
jgi:hypothetical protein